MTTTNTINNLQISRVNISVFSASGIYTPPSNLLWCQVECCGGGGGGAGSAATSGTQVGVAAAGAGGGYARKVYARSSLTPNVSYTIGSGGAGGAAGQNSGTAGGSTTFLGITCNGGSGGVAVAVGTGNVSSSSVTGGTASGGDVNVPGGNTQFQVLEPNNKIESSHGGTSVLSTTSGTGNGLVGQLYGGGGGGNVRTPSQAAVAGNAGAAGVVIITEFLGEP